MFADDTSVFMSNKSIDVLVKTINIELKFVGEWFKANKLSLNLVKTNFILFCSQRKTELKSDCNIAINIDNQCIARVSSTKFLGVHIDEHLTWKEHIAVISKKISKNIGIISRIRHLLPRHILVNLYYTLIYPYMSYCNLVWASTYRTRLTTLTTLQKRVVRIMMNVPIELTQYLYCTTWKYCPSSTSTNCKWGHSCINFKRINYLRVLTTGFVKTQKYTITLLDQQWTIISEG